MSNELQIWEDKNLNEIRKVFAPNLNEVEFKFFVSLGKSLNANPFTREIWAIKFGRTTPASIFCGRDFYRRKAESLPEYAGHTCDAVYENDTFKVVNGIPQHSYTLKNRGALLGAYCVVHKKNTLKPYYVFIDFDEYNLSQSLWKKMPATMIKKVAEAQGLRGAFQGVFQGTYDESEYELVKKGTINKDTEELSDDKELNVKIVPADTKEVSKNDDDYSAEVVDNDDEDLQEIIDNAPQQEEEPIENKEPEIVEEEDKPKGGMSLKQFQTINNLKKSHLLDDEEKNDVQIALDAGLTVKEASELLSSLIATLNERGKKNNGDK